MACCTRRPSNKVLARLRSPGAAPLALGAALIALFWWALDRVETTQHARGVQGGFSFLLNASGFRISESLLSVTPDDSYLMAIAAGLVNTLTVAAIAMPLATVLGIVLGLMRLSPHPLVSRSVSALIEPLRNTPVLLQLFVWYGLLLHLPNVREAWSPLPGVLLSNRGLAMPALVGAAPYLLTALLAVAGMLVWRRRAVVVGLLIVLAGIWLVLPGVHVDTPVIQGFGLRGGWQPSIEFSALLIGLIVFHAAYIADIVRGAVRSVPWGLVEAGRALAVSPVTVARRIIAPIAARVALPSYANQCLALIKNSALAIAIGYQELMAIINTAITQTGHALEGISIAVALYLGIAAIVGALLAWFNKRATRYGIEGTSLARVGDMLGTARLNQNSLWGTWPRALASIVAVLAIGWSLGHFLNWAVVSATWQGGAQACLSGAGACWVAVSENAPLLAFGTMAPEYRSRAMLACAALILATAASLTRKGSGRDRAIVFGLGLVIAACALSGFPTGAPAISPLRWGGLLVTTVLAISAVALSIPIALVLALMRRSDRAGWSVPATALIEAVRGVPLVTQLLFASFVLPMILGPGVSKFGMALAALTLHTACLLAEVIRGALQSIPAGQMTAARALGMNDRIAFLTVIWPQALKIAAPAGLGVFVGAVKDTSLVTIIGIFDVLSAAKAVVAGTEWRPYYIEIYLSVALLYFVVCLALSRVAKLMEKTRMATQPAVKPV